METLLEHESQTQQVDSEARYTIDIQGYEDAGQSYLFTVWQRLCWSGECRLCRRNPEGKPLVPGNTTDSAIFNAAKMCPSRVQFVTPGMSLLEAVFRGLISNNKEPMSFSEIVKFLQDNWGSEYAQRVESEEALQRVLDNPNEYRIVRV